MSDSIDMVLTIRYRDTDIVIRGTAHIRGFVKLPAHIRRAYIHNKYMDQLAQQL